VTGEALVELRPVVMAFLGDFGFQKKALTAVFGLDFFGLENEPVCLRFGWYTLHFVEVVQGDGGVEIGLAGGDAPGFHVLQGF
jgi:hypothetical protein